MVLRFYAAPRQIWGFFGEHLCTFALLPCYAHQIIS